MHKPGILYTTELKVAQFQFHIQEYTNVSNGEMNTGTQARGVQVGSLNNCHISLNVVAAVKAKHVRTNYVPRG